MFPELLFALSVVEDVPVIIMLPVIELSSISCVMAVSITISPDVVDTVMDLVLCQEGRQICKIPLPLVVMLIASPLSLTSNSLEVCCSMYASTRSSVVMNTDVSFESITIFVEEETGIVAFLSEPSMMLMTRIVTIAKAADIVIIILCLAFLCIIYLP